MRIAVFTSEFPSISQTFVMNQIAGLTEAGHDVSIWANRKGGEGLLPRDTRTQYLLARTTWFNMPQNRILRAIESIWVFGRLALQHPGRAIAFVWHAIAHKRYYAFHSTIHATRAFAGKECHFDVLYCHFGDIGVVALRLKKLGLITGNLVTVFHGFDITKSIEKHGHSIYSDLLSEGDLFLPISARWQDRLIELGAQSGKVKVHRMGVDCDKFVFKARSLGKNETIRAVTVARLVKKKGIEYSIRAIAKLIHKGYPIQYKIIGGGPLWNRLHALIQETGCSEHISLAGACSHEEVVRVLEQAHVLLLTSVKDEEGNEEGIPVSIMEAMAMGIPVLSTHHSGIPELVEDGVTGVLVPERDVDAIAAALERLIDNVRLWPEMGKAARNEIEREYNIKILNRRLLEILSEASWDHGIRFSKFGRKRIKTLLSGIFRATLRHEARAVYRSIIYRGDKRYCPVCGSRVRKFLAAGVARRPNARCPICGSLERHRLMAVFFQEWTDVYTAKGYSFLHIAPERQFKEQFERISELEYMTADLSRSDVRVRFDVCNIPCRDRVFDVVYCSHVLEHVVDDLRGMRGLLRVLKPSGWAVLQVPITAAATIEDPRVTDPAERLRLFGQADHVRRYGYDYENRLRETGFLVESIPARFVVGEENLETMGVDRKEKVFFCVREENQAFSAIRDRIRMGFDPKSIEAAHKLKRHMSPPGLR